MKTSLQSGAIGLPGHLGYLDGLRALAAVYVAIHHEQILVLNRPEPLLKKLIDAPFWYGHYAVGLFIVLSGFCLMLPVVQNGGRLRGSARQFFRRRAWRILPPYYLAMAFSLLLIATLIGQKTGSAWDITIPVTPFAIYTHLLLIHDIFGSSFTKINASFWSIAVEWRIYLVFPPLLLIWHRWGGLRTTLLTVLASVGLWFGLLWADLPDFNTTRAGFCPHYLGLFALGMLAAQISFTDQPVYHRLRQQLPWPWLTAGLSLAIAVANHYKGTVLPWVYVDVLVGMWSGCLLVAVSTGRANRLKKLLNWPPLVFIGTFSYSIYLINQPLNQLLLQYVVQPLGLSLVAATVFLLVVGTPLIVLTAYGFYRVAERPFVPTSRKPQPVSTLEPPVVATVNSF